MQHKDRIINLGLMDSVEIKTCGSITLLVTLTKILTILFKTQRNFADKCVSNCIQHSGSWETNKHESNKNVFNYIKN